MCESKALCAYNVPTDHPGIMHLDDYPARAIRSVNLVHAPIKFYAQCLLSNPRWSQTFQGDCELPMTKVFFAERMMRARPSCDIRAVHSGQKVRTSLSQLANFLRNKRFSAYSIDPSWSTSPPCANKGIRTGRPSSDQVFHASHR